MNKTQIAKNLAKHIAGMGYTLDEKKTSHGHALEVVAKVAGLPNWDTLSGLLKSKDAQQSCCGPASEKISIPLYTSNMGDTGQKYISNTSLSRGDAHLGGNFRYEELWNEMAAAQIGATITKLQYLDLQNELESIEMANAQGQDLPLTDARHKEIELLMNAAPWALSNDFGGVISLNAAEWAEADRKISECLDSMTEAEKKALVSCALLAGYAVSGQDHFLVKALKREFPMQDIRAFHEDLGVSIGQSDAMLKLRDWCKEPLAAERVKKLIEAGYSFHVSDFKRPYWQLNGDASEDFDTEQQAIDAAYLDFSKESRADDEFAGYDFGEGVRIQGSNRWDKSDKLDFTKIAYALYGEEGDFADNEAVRTQFHESHKISFHVRFLANGEIDEVYALEMEHGNDIGLRRKL